MTAAVSTSSRSAASGELVAAPATAVEQSSTELPTDDPRSRRRTRQQRSRRQQESAARCAVVQQIGRAREAGVKLKCAAAALGVSARTIRHWKQTGRKCHRRGRATKPCPKEVRQCIVQLLREIGPHLGLEALRALFPDVPRCVLCDLLRRARRVWQRRYRRKGFRLEWHHPGSVWAIDFCDARYPIDGIYPYLFPVRDLASHRQLAWLPFSTQTAEETVRALIALFLEHGCPLVLKCDNGSAFIADLFRTALAEFGVVILYSPPRCPAYNGGLERSNGTHKTYTHQQAVAAGHPYRWTSEDTEQARQLSNTLARPWGHKGPTPEEAWQARPPLTTSERQQFDECLEYHRAKARANLGLAEGPLSREDQARLDRLAVRDALEELGYLTMTRVIRPAKKPKRRSKEQLGARVSRVRTTASASGASQIPAPQTASKSAPAPDAQPTSDVASTAPPAAAADAAADDSQLEQEMLAPPIQSDTMAPDNRDEMLSGSPRASEMAQRGPSHTSLARRCLTLLVSVLKAARYTWW